MSYLYNLILYHPLLNALIFFYNTIAFHDLGLAIIFLTLLIRLILFPLFHKGSRHQIVMQKLQPKLKKIQEVHKDDKEKQAQAMMDLYKEHQVNPFAGILILIVQLPILIALYQMFLRILKPDFLSGLYGFISAPVSLNDSLFGLINLGEKSILIVGLAALAQYFQARLVLPKLETGHKQTQMEKMTRHMTFIGPIMTLVIFYNLPSAIGLYWFVMSLFSIFQQILVNKKLESEQIEKENGKLGNIGQKNN
ncbi:MAG: YidC/Oxa1 family membrane protein insertase [Patescibacteria group bacterium]|nr:membrane protein insertase YidC [Patescibacteria group bacterium]MDE2015149.1 YidC/Oxa1 family membrane protein insertase [Patescibacteria group bacterium]MDE2226577.1 YidC/Oxa1 family membrane protein insertase [Patescibacteria group bacterium]